RPPPPTPLTLSPYTTLFRSLDHAAPVLHRELAGAVAGEAFDPRVQVEVALSPHVQPVGDRVRAGDHAPVQLLVVLRRRLPRFHRSEEHTSELQSLRHLVCRL